MVINKITPLSEGEYSIGFDKRFVPFDPDTDRLEDRQAGSILVEVQPFLIETNEHLIVIDAGLGFRNEDGTQKIKQNIIDAGYATTDVDMVLMSHLHKDHAGGLLDNGYPSFAKAKYYISKKEWDYAVSQDGKSYYKDLFEGLQNYDNLHFLEGIHGEIEGDVYWEWSGGHSPEHIVYKIDGENQVLFYGGDEAPQYKHMIMKYIAKYDYDGKRAMELRDEYLKRGREEGWDFLFYHDIKTPAMVM